ncbi:MAG: hypothetical protein HQM10_01175 [Candidatus Riflebacteria bacterium]|nr:hypothetical protein [Candidatus Riflebacteria bacterium]
MNQKTESTKKFTVPMLKKKSAFLSFEGIMIFSIVVMFCITVYVLFNILNPSTNTEDKPSQLILVYQKILEKMDRDIRFADSFSLTEKVLELKRSDGKTVSFLIENGSLYYSETNDSAARSLLIDGLNQAKFWSHPDLPNLISVLLVPSDRMGFPFFTSFAVRGVKR